MAGAQKEANASTKRREVDKSTFTKSMIGRQVDSRKRTSETPKFATQKRTLPGFTDSVPSSEAYYTKHHATINLCKASPGPKYGTTSSLGKQNLSKRQTFPSVGFGTANRWSKSQPDVTEPDKCCPGPGNYNY